VLSGLVIAVSAGRRDRLQPADHLVEQGSNDQNLWMALGGVT